MRRRASPPPLLRALAAGAVLLLLLLAEPCACEISRSTVAVDSTWVKVHWSFEFARGGTLALNLTLHPGGAASRNDTSLKVLVVTRDQLRDLAELDQEAWCSDAEDPDLPPDGFREWMATLGASAEMEAGLEYTADEDRLWLYMLLLNCHERDYSLRVDLVAVNPGGEYLSLSEVPYKTLYVWLPVSWSLLAAVWVAAWWPYRRFNVLVPRLMTAVPLTQALASLALLYLWRDKSELGVEPVRSVVYAQVAEGLSRGAFWLNIMLMASGWAVTRRALGQAEGRRVAGMVAFLLCSFWAFRAFGGFLLFAIVLAYIWILRYSFAGVIINGALLSHQASLLRGRGVNPEPAPVWAKFMMFRRLQSAVVTFVSVDVIFHLWAAVFLHDEPWMEDLVEHMLTAALGVALARLYRPTPFCPHYFLPATTDAEAERHARFRAAHTWRPGMPMPAVDLGAPFAPPRQLPVVVVRGPGGPLSLSVAAPAFPVGGRRGRPFCGPEFLRPSDAAKQADAERRRRDERRRRLSHRRLSSLSRPAGDAYEELGEAEDEDNAYGPYDADPEEGRGNGGGRRRRRRDEPPVSVWGRLWARFRVGGGYQRANDEDALELADVPPAPGAAAAAGGPAV